jgi:glutathione S-transferase
MLIIHGRINSINVQKVVLACEELRLPYVRHDAGGVFGKVKEPAYLAMNPNGLVPVLIDGDFVLWESNTIVRYLAAQYGAGTLWPTAPKQRALSDRWMDWQAFSFYAAYAPAFMGLVRTAPEKCDTAAIEASIAKTHPLMAMLDAELKGKIFLAGDRPTIGDIALAPTIFRWLNMPIARPPAPHVEAWIARLAGRLGYGNALVLPIT